MHSKIFCSFLLFVSFLLSDVVFAAKSTHYISLLKEMFTKVTLEKNVQAIPVYYDKDFELQSNGKTETLDEFLHLHQAIYKTPIQYTIRYDEKTLLEQGNKVAGRVFITTKRPNESPKEIEVILVAEYKGNKLYRLWELTYPDWSKMKSFQEISK